MPGAIPPLPKQFFMALCLMKQRVSVFGVVLDQAPRQLHVTKFIQHNVRCGVNLTTYTSSSSHVSVKCHIGPVPYFSNERCVSEIYKYQQEWSEEAKFVQALN
jgi:hypothetical protein